MAEVGNSIFKLASVLFHELYIVGAHLGDVCSYCSCIINLLLWPFSNPTRQEQNQPSVASQLITYIIFSTKVSSPYLEAFCIKILISFFVYPSRTCHFTHELNEPTKAFVNGGHFSTAHESDQKLAPLNEFINIGVAFDLDCIAIKSSRTSLRKSCRLVCRSHLASSLKQFLLCPEPDSWTSPGKTRYQPAYCYCTGRRSRTFDRDRFRAKVTAHR